MGEGGGGVISPALCIVLTPLDIIFIRIQNE